MPIVAELATTPTLAVRCGGQLVGFPAPLKALRYSFFLVTRTPHQQFLDYALSESFRCSEDEIFTICGGRKLVLTRHLRSRDRGLLDGP